ncbi:MAG TPA: TlpA disulfide reductase family protein [Candidatus Krumholzibacteria bacterium]|nr:TlpA disulfide reductase family protein [Candidatus Krumholzibacteria bacterium]
MQCRAAGPVVEQIWQDYKDKPFRVLAVDCWNGNTAAVQSFIDATGATFPVLRNGGSLLTAYHVRYDNYVLVDAQGIVRYVSEGVEVFGPLGRFHNAHLRSAIDRHLPTPVSAPTWSTVKSLYRD